VPIIAVDFGYSDVPVSSLKPDRVISAFADLSGAVNDLMTAPAKAPLPVSRRAQSI
jgi:phosphoglycolate phosphatase